MAVPMCCNSNPKYNAFMGIVKLISSPGVLLVTYKIFQLFQMGIVLVCWLRENEKTIEMHIVCFKMMETENNSEQENITQRQEAKRTIVVITNIINLSLILSLTFKQKGNNNSIS